ncbi:hypothetical protein PG987_013035 [Apiospora arundinis]
MGPPMISVCRVNRPKSMRPKSLNAPPRSKACKIQRHKYGRPAARKHEKPATYFSASLETPELRKTNAQLVEDLKSAPGIDGKKLASHMGHTIWEDANDDPGSPAGLSAGNDGWQVHGGRLGRDHTLEDLPNHYLRDCLMSFINERMPQDKAPEARRRVFSDLNEGEIAAYADIIREREVRYTGEVQMWTGSEWRERCRRQEQAKKLAEMADIVKISKENPSIKNMGEAVNISKQETALDHIDEDINMTPHPSGYRDYDLEPIQRSVVSPAAKEPLPQEKKSFQFDKEMNYDCDQVRALIKRFVTDNIRWDLDKFRRTCGLERPQLIGFLEKSGPQAGDHSQAYALCWEFFRRREVMGLAPFFDKKKADKLFPCHKVKLGGGNAGSKQQGKKRKPETGAPARPSKRTRAAAGSGA